MSIGEWEWRKTEEEERGRGAKKKWTEGREKGSKEMVMIRGIH